MRLEVQIDARGAHTHTHKADCDAPRKAPTLVAMVPLLQRREPESLVCNSRLEVTVPVVHNAPTSACAPRSLGSPPILFGYVAGRCFAHCFRVYGLVRTGGGGGGSATSGLFPRHPRWTHVFLTMSRMLLAIVGPRLLPSALDILRSSWEIDLGLEGSLSRLVAIDREDFSSQNKLRLLRICKTLCKPSVPAQVALATVSQQPLYAITYSLLG